MARTEEEQALMELQIRRAAHGRWEIRSRILGFVAVLSQKQGMRDAPTREIWTWRITHGRSGIWEARGCWVDWFGRNEHESFTKNLTRSQKCFRETNLPSIGELHK